MLYLHANWTNDGCVWGQAYCLRDTYYEDCFLAKAYECTDFNDHLEIQPSEQYQEDLDNYLTEGQAWDAYIEAYKDFDR